jgi:hypothetical protein
MAHLPRVVTRKWRGRAALPQRIMSAFDGWHFVTKCVLCQRLINGGDGPERRQERTELGDFRGRGMQVVLPRSNFRLDSQCALLSRFRLQQVFFFTIASVHITFGLFGCIIVPRSSCVEPSKRRPGIVFFISNSSRLKAVLSDVEMPCLAFLTSRCSGLVEMLTKPLISTYRYKQRDAALSIPDVFMHNLGLNFLGVLPKSIHSGLDGLSLVARAQHRAQLSARHVCLQHRGGGYLQVRGSSWLRTKHSGGWLTDV